MHKNFKITQSNDLILAKQTKPLTLREKRLIVTIVGMVQPDDLDFKDYQVSLNAFYKMLGFNSNVHSVAFKKVLDELMSKVIEIPLKDGGWLKTHWVSSAKYIDGSGIVELSFDPKLKPYLLHLKSHFTSYRLSNILSLQSSYSIRLYEIFKSFQHSKSSKGINIKLQEFREMVGIGPEKYPLYGNFKVKVLDKAINEINEKTDLFITYSEIKKVKKVISLNFHISSMQNDDNDGFDEVANDLVPPVVIDLKLKEKVNHLCSNFKLDDEQFIKIYELLKEIYTDVSVDSAFEALIEYTNKNAKQNPFGFMLTVLSNKQKAAREGIKPTLEDFAVRYTREEIIPEWMKNSTEAKYETETNYETDEIKEARAQLLAERIKSLKANKSNDFKQGEYLSEVAATEDV